MTTISAFQIWLLCISLGVVAFYVLNRIYHKDTTNETEVKKP